MEIISLTAEEIVSCPKCGSTKFREVFRNTNIFTCLCCHEFKVIVEPDYDLGEPIA